MRCSSGDQEKMKILVYLIRHGKTEGNLKKAYIGVTDQPLCLEGRAELERLAGCFPLPDEVWHSPLCRCAQTAEILYPGISANVCEDLRECDFGEYEGKTYDQLKNEAAYQKWLDSGGTIPFPGGEDPMAFRVRSKSAFAAIAQKAAERHPDGTLAVVCHGGTIMAVLEAFSMPHRDFYDWQASNGGGYRFWYDPTARQAWQIASLTDGRE